MENDDVNRISELSRAVIGRLLPASAGSVHTRAVNDSTGQLTEPNYEHSRPGLGISTGHIFVIL